LNLYRITAAPARPSEGRNYLTVSHSLVEGHHVRHLAKSHKRRKKNGNHDIHSDEAMTDLISIGKRSRH
jgi:hypothetical protein